MHAHEWIFTLLYNYIIRMTALLQNVESPPKSLKSTLKHIVESIPKYSGLNYMYSLKSGFHCFLLHGIYIWRTTMCEQSPINELSH